MSGEEDSVCAQTAEFDELWQRIAMMQGRTFYTMKGLPFVYIVKGGEIFVDRRKKSITYATCRKAYERLKENPSQVTGPKTLNVFGAPYIWSLFSALGLTGCEAGEDTR